MRAFVLMEHFTTQAWINAYLVRSIAHHVQITHIVNPVRVPTISPPLIHVWTSIAAQHLLTPIALSKLVVHALALVKVAWIFLIALYVKQDIICKFWVRAKIVWPQPNALEISTQTIPQFHIYVYLASKTAYNAILQIFVLTAILITLPHQISVLMQVIVQVSPILIALELTPVKTVFKIVITAPMELSVHCAQLAFYLPPH